MKLGISNLGYYHWLYVKSIIYHWLNALCRGSNSLYKRFYAMFGIVYCLILKRLIQATMTTLQPTTNLINNVLRIPSIQYLVL